MTKRALMVGTWLLMAAACEKSVQEQQDKAEQAQREANEKTAKAQREAEQKIEKAQKEADKTIAKANQQADEESANQQAKANETVRNVHEDLLKDRNDFQVQAHKTVDDVDSKIDSLRTKAQKANTKARADFDAAMKDVEAKRAALAADLQRLENQSAQTFDAFKARVTKEIDEFKKAVDNASNKL
jgi:hypothetical protein